MVMENAHLIGIIAYTSAEIELSLMLASLNASHQASPARSTMNSRPLSATAPLM